MEKTTLVQLSNKISALPKAEQKEVKGGILICCEEKRRNFLGIQYTATEWRIVNDGSIWLSVRM